MKRSCGDLWLASQRRVMPTGNPAGETAPTNLNNKLVRVSSMVVKFSKKMKRSHL